MNINELFEEIQNEFISEELNGEFLLEDDNIVWSYDLNDDTDGINDFNDDEDNLFDFEASSSEEELLEKHQEDLEKLQYLLDRLDETENWELSDAETNNNTITFKIY